MQVALPGAAVGWVIVSRTAGASGAVGAHLGVRLPEIRALHHDGMGTVQLDLVTPAESRDSASAFDMPLLAARVMAATRGLRAHTQGRRLAVGYLARRTAAGAALSAAAELGREVGAVVSLHGRPDLAGRRWAAPRAPALLLVSRADRMALSLNRDAIRRLNSSSQLTAEGRQPVTYIRIETLNILNRLDRLFLALIL